MLDVPTGGRLLVTGANGSGKSSLLAVIDGRLRPDRGTVGVHARRVGTLPQDVTFADPSVPADQVFAAGLAAAASVADRRPAACAARSRVAAPAGRPATGRPAQRRAAATAGPGDPGRDRAGSAAAGRADQPHLAEPGLRTGGGPAVAAGASPGTVIVASHDRWLRRRWDGQELPMSTPSASGAGPSVRRRPASPPAWRLSGPVVRLAQLRRPDRGGLDRGQQRGPHRVVLQLPDRCDGRPAR